MPAAAAQDLFCFTNDGWMEEWIDWKNGILDGWKHLRRFCSVSLGLVLFCDAPQAK